jgi:hypothetical protein
MTQDRIRLLIWGKTYPELSFKHDETVCTGGSLPSGLPIRIYPVRLRYLPRPDQYKLYDWVEIRATPSTKDHRPESHKLVTQEITVLNHLGTDHGWLERRKVIYADRSWHYDCLEQLKARQRTAKTSLGFVRAREILGVDVVEKKPKERKDHEHKLRMLQSRTDLFDNIDIKDLQFYPYKVRLRWRCAAATCPDQGHSATVMDWGLGELARRDGISKAEERMKELANLDKYDLHFYVGNMKAHPGSFGIVGLWYPLLRDVKKNPILATELDLFG